MDASAATPATQTSASPRERQVSDFTALTRTVQEAGLMRRRYGYYWTRFVVLTALLIGLGVAFVAIGESWWQLALVCLPYAAIMAVDTVGWRFAFPRDPAPCYGAVPPQPQRWV